MKILGSLSDRHFEIHMPIDWCDPPRIQVVWLPDPETHDRQFRAVLFFWTWKWIGDDPPAWLLKEICAGAADIWRHYAERCASYGHFMPLNEDTIATVQELRDALQLFTGRNSERSPLLPRIAPTCIRSRQSIVPSLGIYSRARRRRTR